MDQKKVIEQLVKIAEKQQRIINKLAQSQHFGDPSASPPPQDMPAPPHPELHPGKMVMNALPPAAKMQVKDIQAKGDTLEVSFMGAPSQSALDAVTQTVQKLLNTKPPALPFAYKVRAA